eukprot:362868-Chlamydomonas_euryale.AAC.3
MVARFRVPEPTSLPAPGSPSYQALKTLQQALARRRHAPSYCPQCLRHASKRFAKPWTGSASHAWHGTAHNALPHTSAIAQNHSLSPQPHTPLYTIAARYSPTPQPQA